MSKKKRKYRPTLRDEIQYLDRRSKFQRTWVRFKYGNDIARAMEDEWLSELEEIPMGEWDGL